MVTEHNFVKQLNYKNEAALIYVMEHYGGLVKSVVHRHLYNLSQYEDDCINDVFYAVWTHISSYHEEKNSFANWIAGIARLKSLDYVRKYANELAQVHLDDQVIENIPSECDDYAFYEQSLSAEMEQMLSCLKEKDRELFYRLYVEEYTMDEIENDLQIEKSVLYNRLSRGKKKIRLKFGKV